MFKHYFNVALRNLAKNRTFSFINISGLTIGLTSCLLIALYIRHELSYDRFQVKGDRIARVIMEYRFAGGKDFNKGNYTSTKVAPVFKRTFPEVTSAARMTKGTMVIGYQDKLISESGFMWADSSFFDLFSFPLLKGDVRTALSGPRKLILTGSTAAKYFGREDPMGKLMRVGIDSSYYQVTGIMADCPSNSQIKFDFLVSFSSLGENQEVTYWNADYTTFLLLRDAGALKSLQAKLPAFMQKEMAGQGATVNFYLEPFLSIHLHSEYDGFEPNNNIRNIYILGAVAGLILLIAGFTYINLSTARSLERAREVGVRKVAGAGTNQLFWQFIGESILICLLSAGLSLLIAYLLLTPFNQLSGRDLPVQALFSLPIILFTLLIALAVSLLAGSYPALVLARFQPVKVLKGAFKNTSSGQGLRKSLIVFQFVISVFLIASTFILQRQLRYIRDKKLGYDKDQVLVLPMSYKMLADIPAMKSAFLQNPDILRVSRCVNTPVDIHGGYNMRLPSMPENEQISVIANPIDEDYIKTTGLQLIAGSDLTEKDIKDASSEDYNKNVFHYILNESAARRLGWSPEEAIGKLLFMDLRSGYVKGVVKDFHFESLHHAIRPVVLFPSTRGNFLLVKLSGHHLPQAIASLEAKWKQWVPYMPFEYHFLNEDYDALYRSELRLGKVMNLFSVIAVALACLGLFGLSSYSARQRVKEIGIRKVLGASLANLVVILSRDFLLLPGLAILIAFPIAWWAMSWWLEDFTYHTDISWTVFLVTALLTLMITLLTVSVQAVRTAWTNPVTSLRSE